MGYHEKSQADMNMMSRLRMFDVAVVVMALLTCVSVPLTLVQAQPGASLQQAECLIDSVILLFLC
jgi:hypothetical protein